MQKIFICCFTRPEPKPTGLSPVHWILVYFFLIKAGRMFLANNEFVKKCSFEEATCRIESNLVNRFSWERNRKHSWEHNWEFPCFSLEIIYLFHVWHYLKATKRDLGWLDPVEKSLLFLWFSRLTTKQMCPMWVSHSFPSHPLCSYNFCLLLAACLHNFQCSSPAWIQLKRL